MPKFVMFTKYHCSRSDGNLKLFVLVVVHHRCSGNEHIRMAMWNEGILAKWKLSHRSSCNIHTNHLFSFIKLPVCCSQLRKSMLVLCTVVMMRFAHVGHKESHQTT